MMEDLTETKLDGGLLRWAPSGIDKPRELTPQEEIAWGRAQIAQAAKAESRQPKCWKCGKKATLWVRNVHFDNKGERATPLVHASISGADYPGPVPGFCPGCSGTAPRELAEKVYHDRPEIRWGARPTRWFIEFTDSTVTGGECVELKPENLPKIISS